MFEESRNTNYLLVEVTNLALFEPILQATGAMSVSSSKENLGMKTKKKK